MKTANALLFALLSCAVAGGCATADDKNPVEAKAPREYRTGSNIPIKDPTPAATAEDRERTAAEVRDLSRLNGLRQPAGGS
jgi:hypothetical protein